MQYNEAITSNVILTENNNTRSALSAYGYNKQASFNESRAQVCIVLDLDDSFTLDSIVLDILLKDRTTNRNIIWATDDYAEFGDSFSAKSEIESHLFIGVNICVAIRPRTAKSNDKQNVRTRAKAEVFTPSWLCNEQNNLIDEQWFGRKNVFNKQETKSWKEVSGNISFPDKKNRTWKDYVDARRMEISCGEAPYLVSRYDSVTGETIELHKRIGLLDRKMRIVNENTETDDEWMKWVARAYQSIYGYEYQGDNLLIARANLLYTFVDNMRYKFGRVPTVTELKSIATIISWNIWQMDGMTNAIPLCDVQMWTPQLSFSGFFNDTEYNQTFCQIKDWRAKTTTEYASLVDGE